MFYIIFYFIMQLKLSFRQTPKFTKNICCGSLKLKLYTLKFSLNKPLGWTENTTPTRVHSAMVAADWLRADKLELLVTLENYWVIFDQCKGILTCLITSFFLSFSCFSLVLKFYSGLSLLQWHPFWDLVSQSWSPRTVL